MLTIVDYATGYPELVPIHNKTSEHVAKRLDMTWFCRCPRCKEITHDNGGEFIGEPFQEMLHSYGIKSTPTTVKNPQANAIVERLHLTLADVLRMSVFEGDNWWLEVEHTLQSIAWAFRTTVPSTLPHSPGSLAFNYDMIMQTKVKVDWELIKKLKWTNMMKNNTKENSQRTNHQHAVGDSVLIIKKKSEIKSKLDKPTDGPYEITEVHNNGNVTILRGNYAERINIRRIKTAN